MLELEPAKPRRKLSQFLQPALLGVLLGLAVSLIAIQGPGHTQRAGPTPAPSRRPPVTRSCTPQEMAFNGSVEDCVLAFGPIGTCTVNKVSTACPAPPGVGACDVADTLRHPLPGAPIGDSFSLSVTLRGSTKTIYELSLTIAHGYHGDGTYVSNSSPSAPAGQSRAEIAIRVADGFSHRFWEAAAATLTITQSGQSGNAMADMHATSGSPGQGSGGAFKLDGPWRCG